MRPIVASLLALVAATLVAAAQASKPPPPRFDLASGQGKTSAHVFSFLARAKPGKTGQADGTATFRRRNRPRTTFRITVSCLRIANNVASIGGPLVAGGGSRYKGAVLHVFDSQGQGLDRTSRVIRLRTAPAACPAPTPARLALDVVDGDIVVRVAEPPIP